MIWSFGLLGLLAGCGTSVFSNLKFKEGQLGLSSSESSADSSVTFNQDTGFTKEGEIVAAYDPKGSYDKGVSTYSHSEDDYQVVLMLLKRGRSSTESTETGDTGSEAEEGVGDFLASWLVGSYTPGVEAQIGLDLVCFNEDFETLYVYNDETSGKVELTSNAEDPYVFYSEEPFTLDSSSGCPSLAGGYTFANFKFEIEPI